MSSFSEEEKQEYRNDGLTEEEINLLEGALTAAETIEMIPDDVRGFIEEYKRIIPEGTKEGFLAIVETVKTRPDFFQKLVALDMVMAAEMQQNAGQEKPEDTIITRLSDEDYNKASKEFFAIFAGLSNNDRKEFLEMMSNMTEDKKSEMVSRLLNK